MRGKLVFIGLLLMSEAIHAQVNRYFVYFKDKIGTPYSISQPTQFLSARSIARREKQNIAITEADLPVNPAYVADVKATGAKTFFTSRWWNGVLIEATPITLPSITALPFVKEVIFVAPGNKLLGGRKSKYKARKQDTAEDPVNQFQLMQLGLDQMHLDGYRGEGISIAIFDSGFQGVDVTAPFAPLFTENRIKQTFNFVLNTNAVYELDDHGTEVMSVMAAFSNGSYTGGAHKANYFLYLTEDVTSEYRIEEFNWAFAAERADSAGVDIINSSLGYNTFDDASMDYQPENLDGQTALITRTARKAIERGMIVVCSAGNEGSSSWKFVTPPADVVGILAVGSVTTAGVPSSFSSIGPTADNRWKPDVVALGSGTSVVKASGAIGTANGTSVASPLVASLAAGVWQAYPTLTASEVYDLITGSASRALTPTNSLGYGIPHYESVISSQKSLDPDVHWISVYPNPVIDASFKATLKEPKGTHLLITIYDGRGSRLVERTEVITEQNNPLTVDVGTYPAGLYLVQFRMGNALAHVRILKM